MTLVVFLATATSAAVAQNAADGDNDVPSNLGGATFNLAAPDYGIRERQPESATLADLRAEPAASDSAPPALPTAPTPATAPVALAPKPPAKLAAQPPMPMVKVAAQMPKPAAKPAAQPPKSAATLQGQPMSAWRRAYIATHGHQPPVPAP
jgi:hypothetical protein